MKKRTVALFAIALLLAGGFSYFGRIPKQDEMAPRAVSSLRVMSYNVSASATDAQKFLDRRFDLASQIIEYAPDSIGVQEADENWQSEEVGLPKLLPTYAHTGTTSPIYYEKETLELMDEDSGELCPEGSYTVARFRNIQTGEEYTQVNATSPQGEDDETSDTVRQLRIIIESIQGPVVLTGSLGFKQDSDLYDDLFTSRSLADVKKTAEDTMSYGTYNYGMPANFHLFKPQDFIFISDEFTASTYHVDNSLGSTNYELISKHYPVITDLVLA